MDLSGWRVCVTGVSAGVGMETARVLASHGAYVVGATHNLPHARDATAKVGAGMQSRGRVQLVELDLGSLNNVRRCADALLAAGEAFNVIIANAGVMAVPKGATTDGFETQLGTITLATSC